MRKSRVRLRGVLHTDVKHVGGHIPPLRFGRLFGREDYRGIVGIRGGEIETQRRMVCDDCDALSPEEIGRHPATRDDVLDLGGRHVLAVSKEDPEEDKPD
jgi:hypothetical protein